MILFKVSNSVYPVIAVVVLVNKENEHLWIKLSPDSSYFFEEKAFPRWALKMAHTPVS